MTTKESLIDLVALLSQAITLIVAGKKEDEARALALLDQVDAEIKAMRAADDWNKPE